MKAKKPSQAKRILNYLKRGGKLTMISCLSRFGVGNHTGRFAELRKAGHDIKTTMIKHDGKRYAQYYLKKAA